MGRDAIERLVRGAVWKWMGMMIGSIEDNMVTVVLPIRPEILQVYAKVHGGIISTLLDSAMSAAVHGAFASPDARAATIQLSVSYLRAAEGNELRAIGRVVKQGRSLVFCTAEAFDDQNKLVAQATGQFYVSSS